MRITTVPGPEPREEARIIRQDVPRPSPRKGDRMKRISVGVMLSVLAVLAFAAIQVSHVSSHPQVVAADESKGGTGGKTGG